MIDNSELNALATKINKAIEVKTTGEEYPSSHIDDLTRSIRNLQSVMIDVVECLNAQEATKAREAHEPHLPTIEAPVPSAAA